MDYNSEGISRYYDQPEECREKRVKGSTKQSKILKLGSADELRLKDEESLGLATYIRTSIGKEGIPVYIFDDHNHALFAWHEAFREGRIGPVALLLHFDEHSDGRNPSYHPLHNNIKWSPSARFVASYAKNLEIDRFIAPAVWMRLVDIPWLIGPQFEGVRYDNRLTDSKGWWRFPRVCMGMGEFVSMFSSEIGQRTVITDVDIDYFAHIEEGSQREQRDLDILRDIMRKSGVVTIATSPGYIEQHRAIELTKVLLT